MPPIARGHSARPLAGPARRTDDDRRVLHFAFTHRVNGKPAPGSAPAAPARRHAQLGILARVHELAGALRLGVVEIALSWTAKRRWEKVERQNLHQHGQLVVNWCCKLVIN